MKQYRYLLFLSTAVFLASCSSNYSEQEIPLAPVWKDTVILLSATPDLIISNNSLEAAEFHLCLNDRFPLTMSNITKRSKLPTDGWRFVADHTSYFAPITSANWVHDPLLMMNSLGGGYCDDLASALAGIWEESGLTSRIIGLNGHVVSEVLVDGAWQVFDPSLRVTYSNMRGNAVGVSYLEQHECEDIKVNGIDTLASIMMDCNRFAPNTVHQLYRSAEDNTDVTEWHRGSGRDTSTSFMLPPMASVTFINNGRGSSSLLRVMLVPQSTGILKLPFVPFTFSGVAQFTIQQTAYDLSSDTLVHLSLDKQTTEINVLHISDTSYFYCFVNPRLCSLNDTNAVSFMSSTADIDIKAVAQMRPLVAAVREQAFELEFLRPLHSSYVETLPKKLQLSSISELCTEYTHFLLSGPKGDNKAFARDTTQFRAQIAQFNNTMKTDDRQLLLMLQNYYPNLLYEFFIAAKYHRFEHMVSMLDRSEVATEK